MHADGSAPTHEECSAVLAALVEHHDLEGV